MLFGSVTGVLTGALITFYRFCAAHIIAASEKLYAVVRARPILLPAAAAVMAGIALLYSVIYRRRPNLRGGGIPTSVSALRGLAPVRWISDIVGVFFLSLSTFFLGVPLGNEGPSVQIGTAVGRGCIAAAPKKFRAWSRYSMTGGACAGFTAATGAPISGIMFALEDAHRRISPMIIMAAYFSVVFSHITCSLLAPVCGLDTALFSVSGLPALTAGEMWIPAAVGLTLGVFAVLFLKYYEVIHHFMSRTLGRVPLWLRLLGVLLLTLIAGVFCGDMISTGHHLIVHLFDHRMPVLLLTAVLAVRATLTLLANTGGMTGGLFLPIMALGALISAILGEAAAAVLPQGGAYYGVILTLGITACISGMMKTPITAIAFAVEALGCHENIIPVIIAAALSFTVTEIFRVESITECVVESRLHRLRGGREAVTAEKVVYIREGAFAAGKQVRDILWPDGLFVLTVRHHTEDTAAEPGALREGDELYVRYTTYDENRTLEELFTIVGE